MAACGMLAAGLVRLLAKHRRENVVKILLAVALFTGVLLTAKLRIVAVLQSWSYSARRCSSFRTSQASARS